jgi:uncharacterized protein
MARSRSDMRIDRSFLDIIDKNNKAVKELFQTVGINAIDRDGRTLLLNASCYKNKRLVGWAIKNGADINHQDKGGWSALHFAVQENALSIVNLLLDSKINIDICDEHGNTPLWRGVVENCKPAIISTLLANGANPKKKNKHGVSCTDLLRADDARSEKIKKTVQSHLKLVKR